MGIRGRSPTDPEFASELKRPFKQQSPFGDFTKPWQDMQEQQKKQEEKRALGLKRNQPSWRKRRRSERLDWKQSEDYAWVLTSKPCASTVEVRFTTGLQTIGVCEVK